MALRGDNHRLMRTGALDIRASCCGCLAKHRVKPAKPVPGVPFIPSVLRAPALLVTRAIVTSGWGRGVRAKEGVLRSV